MAQENTKTMILYNVDTRQNYTLVIVQAALKQRVALQDFISNHVELKRLKFDKEQQRRLAQIQNFLQEFKVITKFILQNKPTLTLVPSLYVRIETLLKKIINNQGEYSDFNSSLVAAARKGLAKFDGYQAKVKNNNIYQIASVLDPCVKT